MPKLYIRGVIVPNNSKWIYDWLDMEATCPADVQRALDEAAGQTLDVYISSPGGEISAGSDIYTMLRGEDVKIHITGQAHSAASVIAMAGWSEMSPTALMMVHCVSTYGDGNHNDFEHTAEVLRTADAAIASAYVAKSGMTQEEAIEMMDEETWLTAERAVELGLVDAVMYAEESPEVQMAASGLGLISEKTAERLKTYIKQALPDEADGSLQAKLDLLKLKGGKRS